MDCPVSSKGETSCERNKYQLQSKQEQVTNLPQWESCIEFDSNEAAKTIEE